jgi:hypothetical protein
MPDTIAEKGWQESYDKESDVYYVSFGTGEPSYAVEVDDILVIDIGLYSGLPTGYRILNMTQVRTHKIPRSEVKQKLSEALGSLDTPSMSDRETAVKRSLDKVLA